MVNITTISISDDGNNPYNIEGVPVIPLIKTRGRGGSIKLIEQEATDNNDINSAVKSAIKGLQNLNFDQIKSNFKNRKSVRIYNSLTPQKNSFKRRNRYNMSFQLSNLFPRLEESKT